MAKPRKNSIELTIQRFNSITIVSASITIGDQEYFGTGEAKKVPIDKTNNDIGDALAISRALECLSRRVNKRTWAFVEEIERINLKKQDVDVNRVNNHLASPLSQ